MTPLHAVTAFCGPVTRWRHPGGCVLCRYKPCVYLAVPSPVGVSGLSTSPYVEARAEAAWLWMDVSVFLSILPPAAQPVWEDGQVGASSSVCGPPGLPWPGPREMEGNYLPLLGNLGVRPDRTL